MKTISKLEIIKALGEKTNELKKRKEVLIEKLFDIQTEAESQIKTLQAHGLIEISDWGVSFLKRRYNDYMTYNDCVIDKSGGRYDGGDFNQWVPPTDYKMLLEFCEKSVDIIKGMQDELNEKLNQKELLIEKQSE